MRLTWTKRMHRSWAIGGLALALAVMAAPRLAAEEDIQLPHYEGRQAAVPKAPSSEPSLTVGVPDNWVVVAGDPAARQKLAESLKRARGEAQCPLPRADGAPVQGVSHPLSSLANPVMTLYRYDLGGRPDDKDFIKNPRFQVRVSTKRATLPLQQQEDAVDLLRRQGKLGQVVEAPHETTVDGFPAARAIYFVNTTRQEIQYTVDIETEQYAVSIAGASGPGDRHDMTAGLNTMLEKLSIRE